MEGLSEALGGGILVSGIIIVVFILAKYNYLIKRAMIEKGLVPKSTGSSFRYLEIGAIVIGFGVGLMVSTLFVDIDASEDTIDLLVWGTILIFGAFGTFLAHALKQRFAK